MWNPCASFLPLMTSEKWKSLLSGYWFKILLIGVGFRWKNIKFRPFYLQLQWACKHLRPWPSHVSVTCVCRPCRRQLWNTPKQMALRCKELFVPNRNDFHCQIIYEGVVVRRRWLECDILWAWYDGLKFNMWTEDSNYDEYEETRHRTQSRTNFIALDNSW